EDGIRDRNVTGVQTCALPISRIQNKRTRIREDNVNMNRLETWKLLQAQDVKADEEVKERWSIKENISVDSTRNALEYFKTLDMAELLEINLPNTFDDLFED